jgi:hypothetical protein
MNELHQNRVRAKFERRLTAMKRQRPWASNLANGLSTKQIETATATLRAIRQRLDDQVEQGNNNA